MELLGARLRAAVDDDGADADGDLLSDCLEIAGVPTVSAIRFRDTRTGQPLSFLPGAWVSTDPELSDTDGDLLWDSQELLPIPLVAEPRIESDYSEILDAGISVVTSGGYLTSILRTQASPYAPPLRSV